MTTRRAFAQQLAGILAFVGLTAPQIKAAPKFQDFIRISDVHNHLLRYYPDPQQVNVSERVLHAIINTFRVERIVINTVIYPSGETGISYIGRYGLVANSAKFADPLFDAMVFSELM